MRDDLLDELYSLLTLPHLLGHPLEKAASFIFPVESSSLSFKGRFAFHGDIRKAISKTNAVEAGYMTLCKASRNHRNLPNYDAVIKVFI